jgi:hypothetical protein
MSITYRMSTTADEPALVELWSRHSDWGAITVDEWKSRFVHTPLGPASIVLAVDDQTQEIMAQLAYTLYPIMVQGREVKGCRPSAVIINESFRSKSGFLNMQQMMVEMYRMVGESCAQKGGELLYMLPDPRWARLLMQGAFLQSTTFPLWSRPLPLGELAGEKPGGPAAMPQGYSVTPLAPDDNRINKLWQHTAQLYPCMVVRDTRILPWKMSQEAYRLFGVFEQGKLMGAFAVINKRSSNQWLIADVLSADARQALSATLQAACLVSAGLCAQLPADEQAAYRKIAVLSTPTMEPVLQALGFSRDKYDFMLVVQLLSEKLRPEDVAPEQWYVSAND